MIIWTTIMIMTDDSYHECNDYQPYSVYNNIKDRLKCKLTFTNILLIVMIVLLVIIMILLVAFIVDFSYTKTNNSNSTHLRVSN